MPQIKKIPYLCKKFTKTQIMELNDALVQDAEKSVVVYKSNDGEIQIEVKIADETVWLNRHQMAMLFDRDVKTIGKHIKNALVEELYGISTIANFATVQKEGERLVSRNVDYYNLDMVLSVGYRVKSVQGTRFCQWANNVLKEYLLRGYSINRRFERLENRVTRTEEKIEFFVKSALPPVEGIFYDGQIFDAYVCVKSQLVISQLIKVTN